MSTFGGSTGYDPRLQSHRFDSFSDSAGDSSSPIYAAGDDAFSSNPVPETPSPPSIDSAAGTGFGGDFGHILLPAAELEQEVEPEEGFTLREWRRVNEIRLEEKEMRLQIIEDADEYKIEFHRKREVVVENNKSSNREREKLFLESGEKFHAEADKNYWKAIGELILHEVPAIEKRGKKDKEKKPSIVVIQGPKPGKPTDLSRMRQILLKLKHNPPPHMKPKPPVGC